MTDYTRIARNYIFDKLVSADRPMLLSHLTEEDGRLVISKNEARVILLNMVMEGLVEIRLLDEITIPQERVAVYWMSPLQKLAAI